MIIVTTHKGTRHALKDIIPTTHGLVYLTKDGRKLNQSQVLKITAK